ncbi:MAG: peptidoglycan DD-metalloendopeptidase family protein [Synergistes sp.]|nr:peptidoglycan DD-metalloendopeptidase family protein [Synergistes sp.]
MSASIKKVLSLIICVLSLLLVVQQPSFAAAKSSKEVDAEIKRQEREYNKIQSQMSKVKKNINEKQREEQKVTQQIGELSKKITVTQQKVNVVTLKIQKVKGNINVLTSNIQEATANIKVAEKALSKRLVNIYKYGSAAQFNLMISSQGAEDALANVYLLTKIANQDKKLINTLRAEKKRLMESQAKLKNEQQRLNGESRELKTRNKELKSAADERNALLARVRKDKALFIAQQKELLRASQEMQSAIKRLLAEKKRLREEERKKKGNASQPTPTYYKGGRLMWPVQGKLSSTFGTRVHPVFKTKVTHTGIDIPAPKGTPVKAADAGEVLYTGWMRGYGQVVIIDHGANLTTVYAHLSGINTAEDAKVSRGSVIGSVGSTGVATGNHLHFEVRVNGNAVDPMKYLQ